MKWGFLDGALTLFCVLGLLKLAGIIEWNWWWVTLPLWGPVAGVLILIELALLGFLLFLLLYSLLKFLFGLRFHK